MLLGGCGGDSPGEGIGPTASALPEPGGVLRVASPDRIDTLDPLLADDRTERIAARQVHEPLVSRQSGPFEQTRQRPGLARSVKSSTGDTIWIARLRRAVRFQDGEPFDAAAVIENADRWLQVAPELVPDLFAVDSPQPGLVRFQLDRPSPGFPLLLENPRLGLISPDALPELTADSLSLDASGTGTGPFEYRGRDADRVLLARHSAWWGAGLGLGPGVAQIELIEAPSRSDRVRDLLAGSIEIAHGLDRPAVVRVNREPLLAVVGGAGMASGVERSVRGFDSVEPAQSLADVWLTDLG